MKPPLLSEFRLFSLEVSLQTPHALADHFAFRIPKAIRASLVASAYFARFDTTGRYIATARSDSVAVVWDLDTMSHTRVLEGHMSKIVDIK
jgi:COMPASS component SWD1